MSWYCDIKVTYYVSGLSFRVCIYGHISLCFGLVNLVRGLVDLVRGFAVHVISGCVRGPFRFVYTQRGRRGSKSIVRGEMDNSGEVGALLSWQSLLGKLVRRS